MFESLMKSLIGSVWITRFNKNFSVKIVLQLKIPHESRNIVNGKLIVKFKTAKYSTDCGAQLVAEDSLVGSSPQGQGRDESCSRWTCHQGLIDQDTRWTFQRLPRDDQRNERDVPPRDNKLMEEEIVCKRWKDLAVKRIHPQVSKFKDSKPMRRRDKI